MPRPLDIVNQVAKYKADMHAFFLDVDSWKAFKTRHTLVWQRMRFEAGSLTSIPEERGIYAFTLELSPTKLPAHGYIMYIGITGDTSASNLRKRFAQYLREMKDSKGRPRVVHMLKKWGSDLFFNFVPLPAANVSLTKLEKAMLDAIIPPINVRDMSADITAARKAAF
ncbi:GIY-YIG nuclease family protein [Bradyrhizobium sp. 14AA]